LWIIPETKENHEIICFYYYLILIIFFFFLKKKATYDGCYSYPVVYTLYFTATMTNNWMTPWTCLDFCAQRNLPYALITLGKTCSCNAVSVSLTAVNEGICDRLCEGDWQNWCGGWGAVSVYHYAKSDRGAYRWRLLPDNWASANQTGGRFVTPSKRGGMSVIPLYDFNDSLKSMVSDKF
jgi:hypothetical protein